MAIDVLLVDNDQGLAGLDSVLDHVLDAALVLAPRLAVQELLELVPIVAVEVVAFDALRILIVIVDRRVVIVYRILISLSSGERNHSRFSRHRSWQVSLRLRIVVSLLNGVIRKRGGHLLLLKEKKVRKMHL